MTDEAYKSDKPTNARMATCVVALIVLIAVIAFTVFTHYRLI